MKWTALCALAVVLALGHVRSAAADDEPRAGYHVVVDQVELEPSLLTGYELRVYLSALALGGQLLDLSDPKSVQLFIGASQRKYPFALGAFAATQRPLAIVVLVETTADYADVLPAIVDALDHEVLTGLGERAQVAVLGYGEASGAGKLGTAKAARGKAAALAADGTHGDPALLDSIDRALALLRRATPPASTDASDAPTTDKRPMRKMIVLIGDGRDRAGDKDRITRTGDRAAREGVRIHTLAYSPGDVRRPLLALGELSKRSQGTLRWLRKGTPDSWVAALHQLHDEIAKQYVLTFFVPADQELAGKKLHIATTGRTVAVSNELKIPSEAACIGTPCAAGYCAADRCMAITAAGGGGAFGAIAKIVGVIACGLLALGLIGFALTKRSERATRRAAAFAQRANTGAPAHATAAPAHAAAAPAPAAATPLLPDGRPWPALLIMNGPRTGQRIFVRDGFTIGKHPGSDLVFDDGYTSTQHAILRMDARGACTLYDPGSTNGTFVNQVRITQVLLEHGAAIRVGSTDLRFLAQ